MEPGTTWCTTKVRWKDGCPYSLIIAASASSFAICLTRNFYLFLQIIQYLTIKFVLCQLLLASDCIHKLQFLDVLALSVTFKIQQRCWRVDGFDVEISQTSFWSYYDVALMWLGATVDDRIDPEEAGATIWDLVCGGNLLCQKSASYEVLWAVQWTKSVRRCQPHYMNLLSPDL